MKIKSGQVKPESLSNYKRKSKTCKRQHLRPPLLSHRRPGDCGAGSTPSSSPYLPSPSPSPSPATTSEWSSSYWGILPLCSQAPPTLFTPTFFWSPSNHIVFNPTVPLRCILSSLVSSCCFACPMFTSRSHPDSAAPNLAAASLWIETWKYKKAKIATISTNKKQHQY